MSETEMKPVRVRIAPSPTGFLHIGTARTALFNYLFAKKNGGKFILRVEDTDLERSDKKYEKDILNGLDWLGITPDESPNVGGPYAPYRQSERRETYQQPLEKLLTEKKAIYCFHSEKELENEKKEQIDHKYPILHKCDAGRKLSLEEANKKIKSGETAIIRFNILHADVQKETVFDDRIRGHILTFSKLLGDFSIAKNLTEPLYNLAVVIDDHEMNITHIIRGEDHIPNTSKQILIANALGWGKKGELGVDEPWIYIHLPLILGSDRSKLSKRHGATSVNEYKEAGYLPEALVNFMALLGWSPQQETNEEIFSTDELAQMFSIEAVQKSGAIFDITKLDWMNGEYIRQKSPNELVKLVKPFLEKFLKFSIPNGQFSKEYIEKVIALEQPRLKKLSEIGERVDFFFKAPEYEKELLRWKTMTDDDIKKSLIFAEKILSGIKGSTDKKALENAFFSEIGGSDKGIVLWPLRVALSGKKASPGPFEIIEILGAEESIQRLKQVQNKL